MNEHEYWESHPEIRKDLNYLLESDDYSTWKEWQELYKDLPNVQVVMKGAADE